MYRLWQIPTNFFKCSAPKSVGLTGIFPVKVPNIASIKGTVDNYSSGEQKWKIPSNSVDDPM